MIFCLMEICSIVILDGCKCMPVLTCCVMKLDYFIILDLVLAYITNTLFSDYFLSQNVKKSNMLSYVI